MSTEKSDIHSDIRNFSTQHFTSSARNYSNDKIVDISAEHSSIRNVYSQLKSTNTDCAFTIRLVRTGGNYVLARVAEWDEFLVVQENELLRDAFAFFHSFMEASVLMNGHVSSDSKFPTIKRLFRSELISFLPVSFSRTATGFGSLIGAAACGSWFSKLKSGTISEMLKEVWVEVLISWVHEDLCRHDSPRAARIKSSSGFADREDDLMNFEIVTRHDEWSLPRKGRDHNTHHHHNHHFHFTTITILVAPRQQLIYAVHKPMKRLFFILLYLVITTNASSMVTPNAYPMESSSNDTLDKSLGTLFYAHFYWNSIASFFDVYDIQTSQDDFEDFNPLNIKHVFMFLVSERPDIISHLRENITRFTIGHDMYKEAIIELKSKFELSFNPSEIGNHWTVMSKNISSFWTLHHYSTLKTLHTNLSPLPRHFFSPSLSLFIPGFENIAPVFDHLPDIEPLDRYKSLSKRSYYIYESSDRRTYPKGYSIRELRGSGSIPGLVTSEA
ncbi:hypothetical protein LXL04_003008 [Taraxacum kok-saghyz]